MKSTGIRHSKFRYVSDSNLNSAAVDSTQVGIHELLGHGCGKLLQEVKKGEYNFDINSPPTNPITNKTVTSWYLPGQTWGSVFGSVAGAYEECRAECVAMALSCDFEILKIFGFGDGKEDIDGEAGDVLYAAYLSMARAGIASLEMFNPQSRKWGVSVLLGEFVSNSANVQIATTLSSSFQHLEVFSRSARSVLCSRLSERRLV